MHKYIHSTSDFLGHPQSGLFICVCMGLYIKTHKYIFSFHFISSRKDSYAAFPKEIADKLQDRF